MPVNASSRMLDLRLAERALHGEGRSKSGGRISGQMKREEYRKQKKTKQLDKERRLFRDRMNFQERKFLSIQMFKKDLNPFLMVLKNKLQKPVDRVEGDDMDDPDDGLDSHLSSYKNKYLRVKNLEGQDTNADHEITGIVDDKRLKLTDIRRHVNELNPNAGDILSKRKEVKITSGYDLEESLTTSSRSSSNIETLNYPKCLTFPNIYKASRVHEGHREDLNHNVVNLEEYKAATVVKNMSGSRSRTSLILQKAKPKQLTSPVVLSTPVRATRLSAPTSKPGKKSYSDVLIDTCRALGPLEARMAERKRQEAENAEGITERKARILQKCRQGAEQNVFEDARWKLLISMLPTPKTLNNVTS